MQFLSIIVNLLLVFCNHHAESYLTEKLSWKVLEFDWPTNAMKLQAQQKGHYIPNNNCPVGIDVWKNKLFMTVPRWLAGVASSLNYVDLFDDSASPILRPYPNWQAHSQSFETYTDAKTGEKRLMNEAAIISPYRVRADHCNRLWVMDTGLTEALGSAIQIVPSSILIFDLHTDKLIRRIYFDDKVAKPDSLFANIIVDENDCTCRNSFAYMPDLGAYGVVVYSFASNRLWRAEHHYFHFDPLEGDYNIHGYRFQWTDGVFGMSVTNRHTDDSRTIYFHAMSSTKVFSVSNRVLQNETHATSPNSYDDYAMEGDRGPNTHATAEFLDETTGVIFFTQIRKDGIACWNPRTIEPLTPQTFELIVADKKTLVFPNDLKIEEDGTIWVISDNMQQFLYGSLDPNEINYRVLEGDTRWLPGVASSLNYVDLFDDSSSPILRPYPNWQAHSQSFETHTDAKTGKKRLINKAAIVSPLRVRADHCNRLWVMDTGLTEVAGNVKQIVPASIVIFDLTTDKLIRRIYFDDKVAKPNSFFANIIVDENDKTCKNSFAYIPDLDAYGVVVYSFASNRLWRAEHHYFHFDPLEGNYTIHGFKFQWSDGVFGMSVSNQHNDGSRTIYFHALSSTKLFSVSNRVLQNKTRATSPNSFNDYVLEGDRGPNTHATAQFLDETTGVIFFTQLKKDGIACWNPRTYKPLTPQTFELIFEDTKELVFPNDLKIGEDGTIWVISDNMQGFLFGSLDPNEINYRVFKGDTKDLIMETVCD